MVKLQRQPAIRGTFAPSAFFAALRLNTFFEQPLLEFMTLEITFRGQYILQGHLGFPQFFQSFAPTLPFQCDLDPVRLKIFPDLFIVTACHSQAKVLKDLPYASGSFGSFSQIRFRPAFFPHASKK
jgi:hypothetical protein